MATIVRRIWPTAPARERARLYDAGNQRFAYCLAMTWLDPTGEGAWVGRLVEALAERRAKTFALGHRLFACYAPGGMTSDAFVASIDVPRWALADPRRWIERERAPPAAAGGDTADDALGPPGEPEAIVKYREALARRLGRDRYGVWIGPPTRFHVGPDRLTVRAPNAFYRGWLRDNMRAEFVAACEETFGFSAVVFEVAPDGEHALRE